jgi:hypothetical protein
VDVGLKGEAGVRVPQPILHLLDVPPLGEKQGRKRMAEGV